MASLTIPLTPEVRAAYQDLYDELEAGIQSTRDPAARQALLDSRTNVEGVLDKDDEYRLNANTEAFETLTDEISDTNADLETLQDNIQSIASAISNSAEIIAAVTKVLSMVPGA